MAGFETKSRPLALKFNKLGLELKKSKQVVLQGVSGEFDHSSLIAIMGPSGAGKTTFLNTLCNKAYYGNITGELLINGKKGSVASFQREVGFVPQIDTVHTDLTVEENLSFAAALKLPPDRTKEQRQTIVNSSIELLGLTRVAQKIVGDAENKGISGGQLKRVNIGMELVADPTLLFLDEPTSGLDSTSSLEVLGALKRLSKLGVTIITVIHQPRYQIFTMFDSVLLLGVGGKTVFLGPATAAFPWFTKLGFEMPLNDNPADFMMDVIGGNIERKGDPKFKPEHLFKMWDEPFFTSEDVGKKVNIEGDAVKIDGEARFVNWVDAKHYDCVGIIKTVNPQYKGKIILDDGKEFENGSRFTIDSGADREVASQHSKFSPATMELLEKKFKEIDTDNSGAITFDEMKAAFVGMGAADDDKVKELWDRCVQASHAPQDGRKSTLSIRPSRPPPSTNSVELSISSVNDTAEMTHDAFIRAVQHMSKHEALKPKETATEQITVGIAEERVRVGTPRLFQFGNFIRRAATKWFRARYTTLANCCFSLAAALIMGSIYRSKFQQVKDIPFAWLFASMTLGVVTTVAALRPFGQERMIYWREAASGTSTVAYFVAKNIIFIFDVGLLPLVFSMGYAFLTTPTMKFWAMYFAFFVGAWATSGLGLFVAAVMHPGKSTLVGVLVAMILGGFLAGVSPSLESLGNLGFITYASWNRPLMNHLIIEECLSTSARSLRVTADCLGMVKLLGFKVPCSFRIKNGIEKTIAELREDPNIGAEVRNQEFTDCTDGFESQFLLIVFLHGLIWRIVAYLAMRFLNSEKKK